MATVIVTTAFAILFGAVALAMALAFGLGNRKLAGEVTRQWYEQYRQELDAIARESAAQEQAQTRADGAHGASVTGGLSADAAAPAAADRPPISGPR